MIRPNEKPRLWVDFQNTDRHGSVRLNCVGTTEELNRLGLVLREGLELVLYCLELEADGVAHYSQEEGLWTAKVNWDEVRDRSANV